MSSTAKVIKRKSRAQREKEDNEKYFKRWVDWIEDNTDWIDVVIENKARERQ